jgi:hypothetical protein
MRKTSATPTPMPAFAPDDRPDEAIIVLVDGSNVVLVLADGSNVLFVFVVGDEKTVNTVSVLVVAPG